MSLFGSLTGDFEDDPFFGSHMQTLQQMMMPMIPTSVSLMPNPGSRMIGIGGLGGMSAMQIMPFAFPPMPSINIGGMFSNMENLSQNPNCHTFTSSSIMRMTSGPDGRPQVYQESMTSRSAPGGVKETQKTVSDSLTGTRKMAIGHHIGERAHIVEREHNVRNGDQEERQEFINLEEEEADSFNREWQTRSKRSAGAIGGPSYRSHNPYSRSHEKQLALPSNVPTSSRQSKNHSRPIASPRRAIRPVLSSKSSNTACVSSPADSTTSTADPVSSPPSPLELPQDLSTANNRRKREHSPEESEEQPGNKRHSGANTTTTSSTATTMTTKEQDTIVLDD